MVSRCPVSRCQVSRFQSPRFSLICWVSQTVVYRQWVSSHATNVRTQRASGTSGTKHALRDSLNRKCESHISSHCPLITIYGIIDLHKDDIAYIKTPPCFCVYLSLSLCVCSWRQAYGWFSSFFADSFLSLTGNDVRRPVNNATTPFSNFRQNKA